MVEQLGDFPLNFLADYSLYYRLNLFPGELLRVKRRFQAPSKNVSLIMIVSEIKISLLVQHLSGDV